MKFGFKGLFRLSFRIWRGVEGVGFEELGLRLGDWLLEIEFCYGVWEWC